MGGPGEALSHQKSYYVTLDNHLFFALRLTPSKQVKGQFCKSLKQPDLNHHYKHRNKNYI